MPVPVTQFIQHLEFHGEKGDAGYELLHPPKGKLAIAEKTTPHPSGKGSYDATFTTDKGPVLYFDHASSRGIQVTDKAGRRAGYISWFSPGSFQEWAVIYKVVISTRYQRRGVATALLAFARTKEPTLRHSHALTPEGRAWSEATLSVIRPLEFHLPGEHPQKTHGRRTGKVHVFGSSPVTMLTEHPALTEIISRFKKAGIPLYVVGGPVRDLLSEGHPGLDLDMTSPADVPTIKRLVDDLGALAPAGEEFGTVKLIRTMPDGEKWEIEITQHRGEVYDTDSRKPTVQATTDLAKDLGRRDFTLNSMALNTATGEIVDLHDGKEDLKAGILRTPLEPERTFSDDPLRILRLVRFSSTRGMEASPETHEAARKVADRLSIVSPERRLVELGKILKSPRPTALTQALAMSNSLGLDPHLFGGLELMGPRTANLEEVGPRSRLAALTFTTPDASKRLSDLKVTNEKIKHVTGVHKAIAKIGNNPALAIRKHSDAEIEDALEVMRAFGRQTHPALEEVRRNSATLRSPLPVTGRDAPASIKGKEIGVWLNRVETAFLLDPQLTKQAAIALAH